MRRTTLALAGLVMLITAARASVWVSGTDGTRGTVSGSLLLLAPPPSPAVLDSVLKFSLSAGAVCDGTAAAAAAAAQPTGATTATATTLPGGFTRVSSGPVVLGPFKATHFVDNADVSGAVEHTVILISGPTKASTIDLVLSLTAASSASLVVTPDSVRDARSGVLLSAPVAWDGAGSPLPAIYVPVSNGSVAIRLSVTPMGECAELVYPITVDPLATSPAWAVTGTQHEEMFGHDMALGNLNGDTHPDLVIASPFYDISRAFDAGRVSIVAGTPSSFAAAPEGTLELPASVVSRWYNTRRSGFGVSVALGDADGDGYDELLVGATGVNAGSSNSAGAAYLYDDVVCTDACATGCTTSSTTSTTLTPLPSNPNWYVLQPPSGPLSFPHPIGVGVDPQVVSVTESVSPSSTTVTTTTLKSTVYAASAGSVAPGASCEWFPGRYARFDSDDGFGFAWYWGWDDFPSSGLTIDLWYRGTDSSSSATLFSYASTSTRWGFVLRNPANLRAEVQNAEYATGLSVNDGGWHHISMAWSSSTGRVTVIVDGVSSATSGSIFSGSIPAGGSFVVGSQLDSYNERDLRSSGSYSLRDSDVAGIRVWSGARTDPAVVRASIGCVTPPDAASLHASWHLENVEPYASQFGVRDSVSGTKMLGIATAVTIADATAYPPRTLGAGDAWAVTLEQTLNTTVVTTTTTCTTGCGSGAPCKWALAQATTPRIDTSGGGQVGSAVGFGNVLTSSGSVDPVVGRHNRGTKGSVYAYASSTAFGSTIGLTLNNPSPAAQYREGNGMFGNRLLASFNVLGSTAADIIVSAPRHTDELSTNANRVWYQGAVHVYAGGSSPSTAAAWSTVGPQTNCGFGRGLGVADVNGDGALDLLVGAPFHLTTFANDGAVFVYLGDPAGLPGTAALRTDGPHDTVLGSTIYGLFGTSVVSLGDLNLDGCSDIAVGAPGAGSDSQGAVHVYYGCSGPGGILADDPVQTIAGTSPRGSFGHSLIGGVDIDDDGWMDLLVAEPFWSASLTPDLDVGRISLLRGLPIADLSISAFNVPGSAVITPASFDVFATVANAGPAAASAVTVSFVFEVTDGMTLDGIVAAPGGSLTSSCSEVDAPGSAGGSRVSTCVLPALASGSSISLTYSFGTTTTSPSTSLAMSMEASAPEVDENGGATASGTVVLEARVDLQTVLTTQPASIILGEELLFVATVTAATGPYVVARGVTLTTPMPTDAYFYESVSAVTDEAGVSASCFGTSVCSVPRLSPGSTLTATYRVRPLSGITTLLVGDKLTQSFTAVASASDDVVPGNNVASSSAYDVVEACNLFSQVVAAPTTLAAGAVTSVTTAFSNAGSVFCSGVVATLDLGGPGYTLLSTRVPSGGSCGPITGSNTIVCTGSVPNSGGAVQFSFTLRTPPSIASNSTLDLTTTLATPDTDYSNNNASVALSTFFMADSRVLIRPHASHSSVPLIPLATGTWHVVLSALGPSDTGASTVLFGFAADSGIVATDIVLGSLPPGVACTVHAPAPNMTCTVAGVDATGTPPSNELTIPMTVTPSPTAALSLVSAASVTSARSDPNTANNNVVVAQLLNKYADLEISPFVTAALNAGSNLEIKPRVVNLGPNPATGVTVVVSLPPSTAFVSATLVSGSCAYDSGSSSVTCTYAPDLAAGTLIEPDLVVQTVDVGTFSVVSSTSGALSEPNLANNVGVSNFTVTEQADVAARVSIVGGAPAAITPGSTHVYEMGVRNLGPSAARDIVAEFVVPKPGVLVSVSATPLAATDGGILAGTNCTQTTTGDDLKVTCTAPPASELLPSAGVVPLAHVTVFFSPALNVSVVVNGTTEPLAVSASMSVSGSVLDSAPTNNADTLVVNAGDAIADIGVAWNLVSVAPARTGQTLRARLTVGAYGPLAGAGIEIGITIPAAVFANSGGASVVLAPDLSSDIVPVPRCVVVDDDQGTHVCSAEGMAPGEVFVIEVAGVVGVANATDVSFAANVTAALFQDPQLANNEAVLLTQVAPSADSSNPSAGVLVQAERSSKGLGWLLWLIIALAVLVLICCALAVFGFCGRKKPPTESEEEAAKALEGMDDMDSDGDDDAMISSGIESGGGDLEMMML